MDLLSAFPIAEPSTASLNLVERLSFRHDGYSPDFICINGEWIDHESWNITSDRVIAQPPRT